MKTCTRCGIEKSSSEFPKHRRAKDGLNPQCKACHCERSAEWRRNNPEKAKETLAAYRSRNPMNHRKSHLRRSYGIEEEDFQVLFEMQDGKCKICGRTEADSRKSFLCVDHVEGTTLIRGLLCSPCNSAIGLLQHDPVLLKNAVAYLESDPVMEGTKVPRGVHRGFA